MSFDIRAFADRIHRRVLFYERQHGVRPRITPALSRILEHCPEYTPYRARQRVKQRKPPSAPSIRTVVAIAESLECSVGELLGELTISPADAAMLYRVGEIIGRTFKLRSQV